MGCVLPSTSGRPPPVWSCGGWHQRATAYNASVSQNVAIPGGLGREHAVCGFGTYWAQTALRPLWWLNPVIADLGLTSMVRGRHAMQTGQLLTKTRAIERAHAPDWLKDQLSARRRGQRIASPRT